MNDLIKLLPYYYKNSKIINEVTRAIQLQINILQEKCFKVLDNFFLTETETAIERWESIFGIRTNLALSIKERREQLLAKLRSVNTTTKEELKTICQSYCDSCEIVEDFQNYTITIKLFSKNGFKKSILNLKKQLDDVIPTHLKFEVEAIQVNASEKYFGSATTLIERILVKETDRIPISKDLILAVAEKSDERLNLKATVVIKEETEEES